VKPILHLREDLARVDEVRSSRKGHTVIEQEPAIGQVQGRYGNRQAFTNVLPQREIDGIELLVGS
jgi:hypothetical protein